MPSILEAYLDRLRSATAHPAFARRAKDPVSQPVIRIWCEATGDENPAYQDPAWAVASRFGGVIAPPTSMNMWTLPGNRRAHEPDPLDGITAILAERGFTSVAAVENNHEYYRPLRPGDHLVQNLRIDAVSEEKRTALGRGHFVDVVSDFTTLEGERVGRVMMRILRWDPRTRPEAAAPAVSATTASEAVVARRPPRRGSTLSVAEIEVGEELAPWSIPVTQALIATLATATFDFNDVHLDRDAARRRGARDVYMNILGSTGLVNTYLTDWAGPEALITAIDVRLRAQNHPGDTLTLSGAVTEVLDDGIRVAVHGANSLGEHILAECTLSLPG